METIIADQPVKTNLETEIVICPDCKEGQVIPEGRCNHCVLCGWSACSM